MKTRVVNIHKTKLYDVYIGRGISPKTGQPSIWGNPFSHLDGTLAQYKVKTRQEAIEKYAAWILTQPELLAKIPELKGKVLGCFCKPLSCHGEILARLADQS